MIIGITGATGNLGRRLVQFLLGRLGPQDSLRCLVRTAPNGAQDGRIEYVQGDLSQPHSLETFAKDLDVCVHLASLVGFATASEYHGVNVAGTALLCELLMRHAPQCRLVHCSSIAVLRRNARFTWLNTDYANSKFAGEQVVKIIANSRAYTPILFIQGLFMGRRIIILFPPWGVI